MGRCKLECPDRFQYISCYSLSLMFKNSNGDNYVSIHLMLLFILIGPQETIPFMPVSIHLMLLFILGQKTTDRTDGCFNTSHVTLYRRWTFQNRWQWTFQYISCYSLSIPEDVQDKIKKLFQYISCYSLSKISRPWSAVQIPFQYISCYSLSNYDKLSDAWDYCFNTSHVTLYQSFRQKIKCFLVSFNTSHVTLYLIVNCYRLPSIMFQYISCYSLSFCLMYRPIFFDRFNTSHVTLYPFGHHFLFWNGLFQYISCYSLSSCTYGKSYWL